jgi:hypothetical protein
MSGMKKRILELDLILEAVWIAEEFSTLSNQANRQRPDAFITSNESKRISRNPQCAQGPTLSEKHLEHSRQKEIGYPTA